MTTYTGTGGGDNLKGTKFDDYMYGLGGDDFLQGKAGNDYLDGGAGNDTLHGDEGDDTLVGGQGDDFIHGGNGTDTAVYSGSVLEYSFSRNGENLFVSHTGGTHIDGNDRLLQVERLRFSDITIDLEHNNAPLAFDDTASTNEDVGTYSGSSVLANDFDWEHNSLTVANPGTYAGVYGTLVLNANGTYTYTPYAAAQSLAQGQVVQDSFNYVVSDGSLSDTGTLTINLAGVNDAPVAHADTASTGENSPVTVNVLANDTDVDNGAVLTVTAASAPSGQGSASVVGNQVRFDPGTDFDYLDTGETATVVVSYTIKDEFGATSSSTVTIAVNGANDAPVANNDSASTSEDASVSGNVLANDTDVDVEPLTVANPGTYVGSYGTLTLAADGSYTYAPNAAAQGLDTGETAQDVFSYTASDGTASSTATLTVTVNGANDAPVANDDSASTTEDSSGVSGNVLANDTDVDGETLTVANPGTYAGTYGTLVVAADGSYTYTPGAAAQALDTGDVVQDVFTYAATDGTASDTATLTVTVTGINDAPVANDDTATTDENSPVSGNVLANDTDPDDPLTVINPGTFIGAYGTLVLAANGTYTYTPGAAAAALNNGQSANDVFTYIASDGTVSDTATLTVTVNGLSGAPNAIDDSATTNEDSSVSGNVLANDTDAENDPLTVTNPGTYAGTYGTLTLNANGSYTYAPNAAANGLAAGESAQDVFSYTASDGSQSDSANLTITVNGVNDAPTIDASGTDASGSVAELPDGDPGENVTVHSDSGTIAFNDVDVSDTHSASFTPQGAFYLGTFSLDPVDQPGDSVGWDFSVSDAALEGLSEGEIRIQTYTVQIADGHGGTATQNVTITITGAGVGVGPQTVWFIDNSAVGSANTGTAADPFTSIAAFNAAQGTLGGPQPGHTVHLLAGTGTGIYAEADGINLLNGQILVGDSTGAVRPTIEATAGDGINVAQNNVISGIDIGNTSGADIADSGGSVGTLTISDVGTSGTGQIIDVDQGGTLNVTLNGAESLGSAGGAIDLAGVGGSFTVTGATTITGTQSGGGIDITGTSLAVSLEGGGTVSTGAATGINFVGNSGSLALDGGFDIVTTSGAGLNATGGGTVTVTGPGSSVTSTTGTAVTISGTAIGAAGVTLESVSVNGATNGIVLANTGSGGGFAVTGIGTADGSGGSILNTTGRGISVTNAHDISLANMVLTNAGSVDLDPTNGGLAVGDNLDTNAAIHLATVTNVLLDNIDITGGAEQAINGNNVTNFALLNSTITGVGNASDEDGIHFYNMLGTGRIVNTTITGSGDDNLNLQMQSGNLDLYVSGGSASAAVLGGGYLFGIRGTATANIGLENATSQNNNGGGIVADAFDGATMNLRVANSISSGNNDQLTVSAGDSSHVDLDATGNTLSSGTGDFTVVSLVGSAFDTGYEFDARLDGNTISTANGVTADGISVSNPGGGTMNVAITDNVISYAGTTRAILLQEGQDGNGTLRATITGNAIDILLDGSGNATNGILAQNAITGPGVTSHLDLDIGGAGALANTFTHSLGGSLGGGDIRVRQRNDGTVNLDHYLGAPTDTAAVNAYMDARNHVVSGSTSSASTVGFTGNASPAFVTVTVSSVSVDEDGGTNLVYTFTRSGDTSGTLVTDFAVTGTADSADFTLSGATGYDGGTGLGTVTFAAGSATAQIIVDPTADNVLEFAESVVVDAGNGSFAHAFITNDDSGTIMMMSIPAGGGPLSAAPEWLA
ncbi:MAG: tandem-95 repeat protein [Alphaproteobacteria bacterium]|nr:tandem-95 repeat protein [Alphaproteobacteria bacterium]MBV9371565.1 tandem-95 repeat protein [Alphaproteobacteria bacterium]MBV9902693.1 tandem-95 repeat protein [Alphaproteobacteria bacterium]